MVFSVKGRENILSDKFLHRLLEYQSGILSSLNQFPLAVGGYKDHVHLFFELNPTTSLSELMQKVKANSSKWINDNKLVIGHFEWQKGYGAFSHSRSQRDKVIKYIMQQEQHHRQLSFRDEYLKMLEDFNIKFDNQYIFEFYE